MPRTRGSKMERPSGLLTKISELLTQKKEGPITVSTAEHAAVLAAAAAAEAQVSLLMIVPSQTLAERISPLVRWLLGDGPVPFAFPRWPHGVESPYEEVVESPYVAAGRLGCLASLAISETPASLVLDAPSATQRVIPFDAFCEGLLQVKIGREVTGLTDHLVRTGYRRVSSVSEIGEFAVRGGVIDIYSPSLDDPFRVELDGETVVSMRAFDTASQRAQRVIDHAWVVPVWEVPSDQARFSDGLIALADAAASISVPTKEVALIEAMLHEGRLPAGASAMLPIMYDHMDLVMAYVPNDAIVAVLDPEGCATAADASLSALKEEYRCISKRLVAPPDVIAATGAEVLSVLYRRPGTLLFETSGQSITSQGTTTLSLDLSIALTQDVPVRERVSALIRFIRNSIENGERVLLLAPTEAEARRVTDILTTEGLDVSRALRNGLAEIGVVGPCVRIGVGRARTPFRIELIGLHVIPSESIFGLKDVLATRRAGRQHGISDYQELAPGDLVIHRDHGIGRFEGLKEVRLDGRIAECLVLCYQGGDKLYVPVEKANLLDKYVSPSGESSSLDRLGGNAWQRRKRNARKAARELAFSLKHLYARRLTAIAPAFSPPDADFREFEATFPFETTPDQEKAIEEVLEDLTKDRPMDRLICGDVGFGKTEVAIRAAYRAVTEGKQVAVLVPTTLLAEQHRLTFAARFHGTAIIVESLSRLKSPSEERRVLEALRLGGIDVIIGTHRLLSKDVVFKDLGLLIIDEEHRFGVAHKEQIREISANVHTLTLSATPIPRTLHMALAGIRDISIIATPPRDRLAVKTFVARPTNELIRSAIMHELARGGQVFFVHNRVEDIEDCASKVQRIVPEARVTIAHGQMSSSELESVMSAFLRGEKDVLACTTIIESGLDIASANTMLIDNAESLGLAQLYQLRGRVGRAYEQAYCYLLVSNPDTLSGEARKRIEAIERFSELASGFNLAAMDLEIRGAGDVLGPEQSGHMAAVGLEMFMEMVAEALTELSGEQTEELIDPELRIPVEARIPNTYVPDERLRLRLYRRLASARTLEEVSIMASELYDRFGSIPVEVTRLLELVRAKVRCRQLRLTQVLVKTDERGRQCLHFVSASTPTCTYIEQVARELSLTIKPENAERTVIVLPSEADVLKTLDTLLSLALSAAARSQ